MANVLFKRGTQANLNELAKQSANILDGAFYLTTDSHRLYVGQGSEIVPVNEGVSSIASINSLPTVESPDSLNAGHFYYAEKENILCIHNGQKWVQINPDTDTWVDAVTLGVTVASNAATITTKITSDSNIAGNSHIGDLSDNFKITGANGINVTASGKNITLTGDKYTLSKTVTESGGSYAAGAVELKLQSQNQTSVKSSAKIIAGSNVQIKTVDGNAEISAKNTVLGSVSGGAKTGTGATGFQVTVADSDNNGGTATIDPEIVLGNATSTKYKFSGGVATLPVYTKTEVDNKFRDLNGLTYKGTVGAGGTYTDFAKITSVSSGDMYMVTGTSGVAVPGHSADDKAHQGDLVIATGTENSSGVIASPTWTIVPSGDDIHKDTTYSGKSTTTGIELKDSDNNVAMTFNVAATAGDEAIVISNDNSDLGSKTHTAYIGHKTITSAATSAATAETAATQTAGENFTITAVTGVTRNKTGHVTGVKTKSFTVKDTQTAVTNVTMSAQAANVTGKDSVKISTSVTTTDGTSNTATKDSSIAIESTSLTLADTSVSGGAASMSIELVWGTF